MTMSRKPTQTTQLLAEGPQDNVLSDVGEVSVGTDLAREQGDHIAVGDAALVPGMSCPGMSCEDGLRPVLVVKELASLWYEHLGVYPYGEGWRVWTGDAWVGDDWAQPAPAVATIEVRVSAATATMMDGALLWLCVEFAASPLSYLAWVDLSQPATWRLLKGLLAARTLTVRGVDEQGCPVGAWDITDLASLQKAARAAMAAAHRRPKWTAETFAWWKRAYTQRALMDWIRTITAKKPTKR